MPFRGCFQRLALDRGNVNCGRVTWGTELPVLTAHLQKAGVQLRTPLHLGGGARPTDRARKGTYPPSLHSWWPRNFDDLSLGLRPCPFPVGGSAFTPSPTRKGLSAHALVRFTLGKGALPQTLQTPLLTGKGNHFCVLFLKRPRVPGSRHTGWPLLIQRRRCYSSRHGFKCLRTPLPEDGPQAP